MPVSKEVQDAVDKVRAMKDYIAADREADKIRDQQLADAKAKQSEAESKLSDLEQKLAGLQVNQGLSQEDKDALQHAFDDASEAQKAAGDATSNAAEVHDELTSAVPANTGGAATVPDKPAEDKPVDPQAKYRDMTADQLAEARGEDKASGEEPPPPAPAPLMPNMAFDPAGGVNHGPGDAGQPNQPPAIETAGGFVVSGGGTTQRAPGSRPESPSSSVVVPQDPNAKAPASTADEVKSGLGDSSQNALIGSDGKPVQDAAAQQEAAIDPAREQQRQDQLRAEAERKADNPLNLSDEDLRKRDEGADADRQRSNPTPDEKKEPSPAA